MVAKLASPPNYFAHPCIFLNLANEQQCLRWIKANLMEVIEEWEYGILFLRMETG